MEKLSARPNSKSVAHKIRYDSMNINCLGQRATKVVLDVQMCLCYYLVYIFIHLHINTK